MRLVLCDFVVFFFFVKQKTAYEMRISGWSSDVCSSDLAEAQRVLPLQRQVQVRLVLAHQVVAIRLGAEVLLPVCIGVAAIEVDAVVTTPQLADEIGDRTGVV